jgi:hypothetical protein
MAGQSQLPEHSFFFVNVILYKLTPASILGLETKFPSLMKERLVS